MQSQPSPSIYATLNDLARSSLGVVLSFLLSTSLIGGSSFVVFDFPGQLHALNRRDAEVKNFVIEDERFAAMIKVTSDGWGADSAGMKSLIDLNNTLLSNIDPQNMDDAALTAALRSSRQQSDSLLAERGTVRGYAFTNGYFKTVQEAVTSKYDAFRGYVFTLQDAVIAWKTAAPDERRQRLLQATRAVSQINEAVTMQHVLFEQAAISLAQRNEQFQQQLDENNTERRTLIARLVLSVLGILVGAIVLVGLLLHFGQQFTRSKESPKQDELSAID